MDSILLFIALGLWTFVCLGVGAVLGYMLRYTMERSARADAKSEPVCYGKSGKGCSKPPARCSNSHRRASQQRDGHTSGDDTTSNLGFDVLSDDADPVPETVMPPPPPPVHDAPRPTRNHHYTERGNVPFYFTDTDGTRIHTRQNCQGLRTVAEGGRRVKPLKTKSTCSWCCDGVMVIP